jgi:hypothetical protein
MKIVYTGPSPAVVGNGWTAVNGEPFDVPDELGKSLCEQEHFAAVKKTNKADPAASEIAASPQED